MRQAATAIASLLACLTGCSGNTAQVATTFLLPADTERGAGLSLQSGLGPSLPAFANAFNGYVGSVAAVGPLAAFERPSALAFSPDGTLFVADGPCIRRIAPDAQGRQTVSTVAGDWTQAGTADGPVFQARFNHIGAMVVTSDGSLIVADEYRLRRIAFDGHGGGTVTTVAGEAQFGAQDGDGTGARFFLITALAAVGNRIYAAEANRVRQIEWEPSTGRTSVSTFYSDGVYDPEADDSPTIELVAASSDDAIWIGGNGRVRRLRRGADGKGAPDLVVLGTEPSRRLGEASLGAFGSVRGLGVLPNGDVAVVAVNGTYNVRRIAVDDQQQAHVSLLARSLPFKGPTRASSWLDEGLSSPGQLALGPRGEIRVLDNTAIRAIELDAEGNGTPSTFAGWPIKPKRQDGPASATSLHPQAIVANGRGGYYIAVKNALYEMELTAMGGATTRFLAGDELIGKADGIGDQARFDLPNALLVYPDGSLIVSDYQNLLLRRVTFGPEGKATVSTIAGGGKIGGAASLTAGDGPGLSATVLPNHNLCLGPDGTIYFGDRYRVRKLTRDPDGQWRVTSLAGCANIGIEYKDGPGEQARFGNIGGMAMDRDGALIIADTDNNLIRKMVFDAAGRATVSTLAGQTAAVNQYALKGFKDGPASEALFNKPSDVDIAADGALLLTDFGNSAIRRLARDASGNWQVSTLIGPGEGMHDGPFSVARLFYPIDLEPDGPGRFLCLDGGGSSTYQIRTIRMGGDQ